MKTKELADWIGVSAPSIRLWATEDEFARYLSPTGAGGEGKTRAFSDEDARIFAYIAHLKHQGLSREEIYLALDRMQQDDWQDLPEMPPAPASMRSLRMIPEMAADTALSSQKSAMMREITILQDRVEGLEETLSQERSQSSEKQEALLREIAELRAKLERANTIIELYDEGRLKPKE